MGAMSTKHRRIFLIFIAIYSGTCHKSSQDEDSLVGSAAAHGAEKGKPGGRVPQGSKEIKAFPPVLSPSDLTG